MKCSTVLFFCVIVIANSRQFDRKESDKINFKIKNYFKNVGSGFGDFDDDDDIDDFGSGFIGNYYQFLSHYFL